MAGGVVIPDRRKALLLLAGSRYDVYAPGPKIGQAFRHGKAAPTVKELCLLCDGDKVTRDRFGRESTCESCKGRGWHKIDPGLNKEHRRSWEEQAQATAGTRRALCDHCGGKGVEKPAAVLTVSERCRYCDGAGKISVPLVRAELSEDDRVAAGVLNDWDRMMVRREESGSYKRYDAAISALVSKSPHLHRIFHRVYVIKEASPGLLHPTEARSLELAIATLLRLMPDEILVPREIVALDRRQATQPVAKGKYSRPADRAVRDAEIVARFKGGESAKELAAVFGLSVQRVNEIVYHEREVA